MIKLNPKVDLYLKDGCGRCAYYATAKCKIRNWQMELETLRQIALECGLKEEIKWGIPVYTFNQKNIISVSAFKNYACISFFKGSLIKDPFNLLVKSSENAQSFRLIKYTDCNTIESQIESIQKLIQLAIELEERGEKIDYQYSEPIPDELLLKFEEQPQLKKSFYALTPGRQRGYLLYFKSAKQSATRTQRIEKSIENILKGKGINDDYQAQKRHK